MPMPSAAPTRVHQVWLSEMRSRQKAFAAGGLRMSRKTMSVPDIEEPNEPIAECIGDLVAPAPRVTIFVALTS
jgi:hypothetical protein